MTIDPHPAPIKAKVEKKDITLDDLIMEFSHNDHLVGQINNLFMKWADLNGALSEECQQLALMFNQSVDQAKHGTGNVAVSDHLRVRATDFSGLESNYDFSHAETETQKLRGFNHSWLPK
jgi:hypothetical protein